MERFIDFEILKREGKKVTVKIRSVKWGVELPLAVVGTDRLERGEGKLFESGILGFRICSSGGTHLYADILYIHGRHKECDGCTSSLTFDTEERAIEVFEGLKAIDVNQSDNRWINELLPKNKAKIHWRDMDRFVPSFPPRINYEALYGMDWGISEPARTYSSLHVNGKKYATIHMDESSPTDWTHWAIVQSALNDANEYSLNKIKEDKKIKEEVKMKIVKKVNLTAEEAIKKFDLDNAYIEYGDLDTSTIRFYDKEGLLEFNLLEDSGALETQEYNKETKEETTYIITNADEFIKKLNDLKPYDKGIYISKYAPKPKFALGDKVVYTPKVELTESEKLLPTTIQEEILAKKKEKGQVKGIIQKMEYAIFDKKVSIVYGIPGATQEEDLSKDAEDEEVPVF